MIWINIKIKQYSRIDGDKLVEKGISEQKHEWNQEFGKKKISAMALVSTGLHEF